MPSYLLGPSLFIAILEILAPGFSPGFWLLPYPIFQLLDQEKHPGHDASLKTKADHKAQDWSFCYNMGVTNTLPSVTISLIQILYCLGTCDITLISLTFTVSVINHRSSILFFREWRLSTISTWGLGN